MSNNDGGPAFPSEQVDTRVFGKPEQWTHYQGMPLRDWFAGQAMQGMWSNSAIIDSDQGAEWIANAAWKQADAMLAKRNRRGTDE